MIRLGLCCMFRDQPIKFVTTTATSIGKMKRTDALEKLSRLCLENADALLAALVFCADNGIGCFRVNSQISRCNLLYSDNVSLPDRVAIASSNVDGPVGTVAVSNVIIRTLPSAMQKRLPARWQDQIRLKAQRSVYKPVPK